MALNRKCFEDTMPHRWRIQAWLRNFFDIFHGVQVYYVFFSASLHLYMLLSTLSIMLDGRVPHRYMGSTLLGVLTVVFRASCGGNEQGRVWPNTLDYVLTAFAELFEQLVESKLSSWWYAFGALFLVSIALWVFFCEAWMIYVDSDPAESPDLGSVELVGMDNQPQPLTQDQTSLSTRTTSPDPLRVPSHGSFDTTSIEFSTSSFRSRQSLASSSSYGSVVSSGSQAGHPASDPHLSSTTEEDPLLPQGLEELNHAIIIQWMDKPAILECLSNLLEACKMQLTYILLLQTFTLTFF